MVNRLIHYLGRPVLSAAWQASRICISANNVCAHKNWGHLHSAGFPPLPVHRLDMDTSGVLVLAKDSASAADVHAQFRWESCRLLSLLHSLSSCAGPVPSLSYALRFAEQPVAALRLLPTLQAAHRAESLPGPGGRSP